MKAQDKKIIRRANKQRKYYQKILNRIKRHRHQKAKRQLIVKQHHTFDLDDSSYKQVLNNQLTKDLKIANKKHGFTVNIIQSSNEDYKNTFKLLKLNLIEIKNKDKNVMVFKATQLGKALLANNTHNSKKLMKLKRFRWCEMLLECMLIVFCIWSLFLQDIPMAMIWFTTFVFAGLLIGDPDNPSNFELSKFEKHNNSIDNEKALRILKRLLNSKDYRQEYKIFKYYATR